MKHILITIAAVVLVGCGESQQSAPSPETKPVEPVAQAATPEPPTAEASDISIHDAAKAGNIEAVKQHLAAGADVELKCVNCGGTVLGHAVSGGHIEIVELLVNKGENVNAKDKNGRTPLQFAADEGHKEIAELLIDKGADVNAKSKYGVTPLHYAAGNGHKEIAELLIDKGADVDAKADNGITPLDAAIKFKKTELADLIRKHGGKTAEELKAEGE